MAAKNYFGRLCLKGADGGDVQVLTIKRDITFGCEPPAQVRIRSRAVQRRHAVLRVVRREETECWLECLARSAVPRVNGVRMKLGKSAGDSGDVVSKQQLHHMDVISIAGRSFEFQSNFGSTAGKEGNLHVLDEESEIDSMSLDSRSSRCSMSSQVSSSSTFNSSQLEKAFARLYLRKKDGSESTPYSVVKEVTIGSQRPSNIRIKTSALEAEHVKLFVNSKFDVCSMSHIAAQVPPRLNGQKMKIGSTVVLGNNDVISIAGREFIFRTVKHVRHHVGDVENVNISELNRIATVKKINDSQRNLSRTFGSQINENNGNYVSKSSKKLRINTDALSTKKDSSPLHSLSSLSSLSAGESDNSCTPPKFPQPQNTILLTTTGGAENNSDPSGITKTYRSGEKRRRDKAKKHVKFDEDSIYDDDEEDVDDDDAFFDIIAEADRLMLNNEEKYAYQVDYERLAMKKDNSINDPGVSTDKALSMSRNLQLNDLNEGNSHSHIEIDASSVDIAHQQSSPVAPEKSETSDSTINLFHSVENKCDEYHNLRPPQDIVESINQAECGGLHTALEPLSNKPITLSYSLSRSPIKDHTSYLGRIIQIFTSLSVNPPVASPEFICHDLENNCKEDAHDCCEIGNMPPPLLIGSRKNWWFLSAFRYLSRRWRGFF